MKAVGVVSDQNLDGKSFVSVEVRNNGDRKTTLTHLVGFGYKYRIQWLLRRDPSESFVVGNPVSDQIPCVLDAGERWLGMVDQQGVLQEWKEKYYIRVGVFHVGSRKPVTARLVLVG
jgi:hypothetical protein